MLPAHFFQKRSVIVQKQPYNRTKANLGKQLELLLDMSNNHYRNKGVADIGKVPTPVQITGNKGGGVITGRLERGEWVDYVGICNGRTIIFDAKETGVKNFPLSNLQDHQYQLLKSYHEKGGIAFLVVSFTKMHEEIYYLPFRLLREHWDVYKAGGKKSIPHSFFVENCDLIKSERGVALHYLKRVLAGQWEV